MSIALKRAYENPGSQDGTRILVDGLWPRGVKKEDLQIAEWMRAIAPSAKLRQWYGHDPKRWKEFRERYRHELAESPRKELVSELAGLAKSGKLTLVFGARDAEHCNATVIAEIIREKV
ncbi:MAG TPA: DUF488 family protein [Terriglobia bacterium]|nr:DUF488 family protein [Terriglobia bacterium]